MSSDSRVRGVICAMIAILLWSTSALLYCHLRAIHALQVSAVTCTLGGLISIAFATRPLTWWRVVPRSILDWILILFLTSTQLCYIHAFRTAPASHVDLINYLWPIFLVVAQSILLQETLRIRQFAGLLLGFCGPILLVGEEVWLAGYHPAHLIGYAYALGAALSWTGYNCLLQRVRLSSGGEQTGIHLFWTGILTGLLLLMTKGHHPMSLHEWITATLVALAVFGFAFPLWQRGLALGSYRLIAGLAYLIPLLSIALLIVGHEARLSWALAVAPLFVALGCFLLSKERGSTPQTQRAETE